MSEFLQGIELSRLFFVEVVRPILYEHYPQLRYSAALIGSGSEVLGFDNPMSSDHHWGPRAMLFLTAEDHAAHAHSINHTLRVTLPYTFRGYSTNFTNPIENDNGTQLLEAITSGEVNHRVEILVLEDWMRAYLGVDVSGDLSAADWLVIPSQHLRTVIAGAVYHDDDERLTALREKLAYYPHDVWLYQMLAAWSRIGQEEHFTGRTGYVGDELGSRLIAARLVHDMMNLCFLMERQYAPYSKWFGTAFQQLDCAAVLTPIFQSILDAQTWQERETHLSAAYRFMAQKHNGLGITAPQEAEVSPFHGRPFMVIHAERFCAALYAQISDPAVSDPAVKAIAQHTHIGGIDRFTTNTDLLSNPALFGKLKALYRA